MVTEITDQSQYESIWAREELPFLQSWQWGEVKRGSSDIVRLLIEGVVTTVFVKKLGFLPWRFGYIPRPFSDTTLTADRLSQLKNYLHQNLQLTHILIDPNAQVGSPLGLSPYEAAGFSSSWHTVQPNQTNVIDLGSDESELFARMTSTYRKKIRRAQKHGCTTEVVNANDPAVIDRFYPIVDSIYRRTDYVMFGRKYYERIWNEFRVSGRAVIVFVKYQGRDIGALFYVNSVDTASELYGGVVAEGLPLQANYLLKWAGIQHAKALGLRRYDMWGVGPMVDGVYLPNDPLYNISLFKKDFGGTYVQYLPQQKLVFERFPHLFYQLGIWGHGGLVNAKKVLRRFKSRRVGK